MARQTVNFENNKTMPTHNIKIIAATLADYPLIQNMARFYVYDLSRQCGFISKEWTIPEDGLYESFDLKPYFEDPGRRAYLIRVEEELAGFTLLNQIGSCVETEWNMGEFFILAKFQGKGVGKYVAQALFDKHPGTWEVAMFPENQTGLSFWRKTIADYMQEQYHCETKHIRPGQAQPYRIVFSFDTRLKTQSLAETVVRPSHMTRLNYLPSIVIDHSPNAQNDALIRNGIVAFNQQVIREKAIHWSIYVKDEQQEIIGGALIWEHSDALYIDVLWIHEAFRLQGIGHALLTKIEAEAKRKCLFKIYVDTYTFQAQPFYKKHGFYCICRVPDYLRSFDRIFMRKDLGDIP